MTNPQPERPLSQREQREIKLEAIKREAQQQAEEDFENGKLWQAAKAYVDRHPGLGLNIMRSVIDLGGILDNSRKGIEKRTRLGVLAKDYTVNSVIDKTAPKLPEIFGGTNSPIVDSKKLNDNDFAQIAAVAQKISGISDPLIESQNDEVIEHNSMSANEILDLMRKNIKEKSNKYQNKRSELKMFIKHMSSDQWTTIETDLIDRVNLGKWAMGDDQPKLYKTYVHKVREAVEPDYNVRKILRHPDFRNLILLEVYMLYLKDKESTRQQQPQPTEDTVGQNLPVEPVGSGPEIEADTDTEGDAGGRSDEDRSEAEELSPEAVEFRNGISNLLTNLGAGKSYEEYVAFARFYYAINGGYSPSYKLDYANVYKSPITDLETKRGLKYSLPQDTIDVFVKYYLTQVYINAPASTKQEKELFIITDILCDLCFHANYIANLDKPFQHLLIAAFSGSARNKLITFIEENRGQNLTKSELFDKIRRDLSEDDQEIIIKQFESMLKRPPTLDYNYPGDPIALPEEALQPNPDQVSTSESQESTSSQVVAGSSFETVSITPADSNPTGLQQAPESNLDDNTSDEIIIEKKEEPLKIVEADVDRYRNLETIISTLHRKVNPLVNSLESGVTVAPLQVLLNTLNDIPKLGVGGPEFDIVQMSTQSESNPTIANIIKALRTNGNQLSKLFQIVDQLQNNVLFMSTPTLGAAQANYLIRELKKCVGWGENDTPLSTKDAILVGLYDQYTLDIASWIENNIDSQTNNLAGLSSELNLDLNLQLERRSFTNFLSFIYRNRDVYPMVYRFEDGSEYVIDTIAKAESDYNVILKDTSRNLQNPISVRDFYNNVAIITKSRDGQVSQGGDGNIRTDVPTPESTAPQALRFATSLAPDPALTETLITPNSENLGGNIQNISADTQEDIVTADDTFEVTLQDMDNYDYLFRIGQIAKKRAEQSGITLNPILEHGISIIPNISDYLNPTSESAHIQQTTLINSLPENIQESVKYIVTHSRNAQEKIIEIHEALLSNYSKTVTVFELDQVYSLYKSILGSIDFYKVSPDEYINLERKLVEYEGKGFELYEQHFVNNLQSLKSIVDSIPDIPPFDEDSDNQEMKTQARFIAETICRSISDLLYNWRKELPFDSILDNGLSILNVSELHISTLWILNQSNMNQSLADFANEYIQEYRQRVEQFEAKAQQIIAEFNKSESN